MRGLIKILIFMIQKIFESTKFLDQRNLKSLLVWVFAVLIVSATELTGFSPKSGYLGLVVYSNAKLK